MKKKQLNIKKTKEPRNQKKNKTIEDKPKKLENYNKNTKSFQKLGKPRVEKTDGKQSKKL